MPGATFFYDLASPYAYLAAERLATDDRVAWQPVLAGAIFGWRGRGSWAHTAAREANIAEIEARAARRGLPPLAWPHDWPGNSLAAMRAATFAQREGAGRAFALAAFRRVFAEGASVGDPATARAAAAAAGLDPGAVEHAIADPAVKDALKDATAAAYDLGVRGVPTLRVGDTPFFGDDRLDEALAALAAG